MLTDPVYLSPMPHPLSAFYISSPEPVLVKATKINKYFIVTI